MALVQFERGWRVRHDNSIKVITNNFCMKNIDHFNIKEGIVKCKEAILLILGKTNKIDEKLVKLFLQNTSKTKTSVPSDQTTQSTIKKANKLKKTARTVAVMSSKSKMLGKMNKDVAFLEKFLENQAWRNNEDNPTGSVNNLGRDQ